MKLNIEKGIFKSFDLIDISNALRIGLANNYKNVEVDVVECPNLRSWDCPSEGISGNQKIIDVGGEPYMHDKNYIGTEFDYQEISKRINSSKSYALGAGSGAMSCLEGHCGELIINENLITEESHLISFINIMVLLTYLPLLFFPFFLLFKNKWGSNEK